MDDRRRKVKTLASLAMLAAVIAVAMPPVARHRRRAAARRVEQRPARRPRSGRCRRRRLRDHYAYVSGWGGITVLDIARADSPQLVGALPLPHFENEDVDLCGNTLIVVNDREASDLGALMCRQASPTRLRPR